MLVSWRWCCHCFYGKFWRHDVQQQDLNFHTNTLGVRWCLPADAALLQGGKLPRRCRGRRTRLAPWPRGEDLLQRGLVVANIYFFPLCVFLGWRSNNIKLTSTMLRLLYQQSCLYEGVNTSTTDRVDWNEFEQTNVPGEGLVSWWSW